MKSWDFFDTLLGRACGEPWRVFELMGGEDFKVLRQQAEQKSDKSFSGIYASLRQMTGWSADKVAALQEEELQWERRLAFPIRENVAQVRARDLVITDTYFNAAQVRDLADLLHLPPVEIIASYGGKHDAIVWRELRKNKRVLSLHTGDNLRADYSQPRRHGFRAVHFLAAAPTGLEKTLMAAGYWDVAGLARCVRLQNPYPGFDARHLAWNKQSQYNIPFLLLTAARLRQYAQQHNHKKIWFLSRDTCLLEKVFRALYPDVPAATFYASRQTYTQPSEDFIAYARAAAAEPRSLFVDLQGTGNSVQDFMRRTDLRMDYLYVAAPSKLQALVPRLYDNADIGTALEVFNYDMRGRVIDVLSGAPVRDAVEYDVSLVAAAHGAVDCLLLHIFRPPTPPPDDFMQLLLFQLRQHPLRDLVRQHKVIHPFVAPVATG
jgi:hypothetical protein